MKELWTDIPGYKYRYQVSNYGNIKSLQRIVNMRTIPERLLKHGINAKGYHVVSLSRYGHATTYYVHLLVAQAFIDNDSLLPYVYHIDNNKDNNTVSNLLWCK